MNPRYRKETLTVLGASSVQVIRSFTHSPSSIQGGQPIHSLRPRNPHENSRDPIECIVRRLSNLGRLNPSGTYPPLLTRPRSSLLFSCGPRERVSLCLYHPGTMSHDFVGRTFQLLSDMDYKRLAALGGTAAVVYAIYRRYTGISLDDVPGPENPSFLHGMYASPRLSVLLSSQWGIAGHQPFLQDAEAGELEHHYLTTYGSIVRWRGPLGVRELWEPRRPFLPDFGF